MAEEILFATLDGDIPLQEVLTWISDETCGPSLQQSLTCSRGDFVLCILNYLRESTERAWPQSSMFQSPIKSVKKSAKINSLNRQTSPLKSNEKKFARRVELFPTGAPTSIKPLDHDKNPFMSKSEADVSNDSSFINRTCSPNTYTPSPYREAMGKCMINSRQKEEENPFSVSEVSCLATSSPLSVSLASDGSQHTPINRRVQNFKSNERGSPPVGANSPDYHFKTPTRGNSMCLGDFLIKGGKSQQSKKRFSPSPTNSPMSSLNSTPVDHQNSHSFKKKNKRRINPTKVTLESSPSQNGFQETETFGSTNRSIPDVSPFKTISIEPIKTPLSFTEERNLLKQERLKIQNQGDNTVTEGTAVNCAMPTKSTLSKAVVIADPLRVVNPDKLLKLGEMYSCVLNANLIPNIMSELYFVVSLLIIQNDLTEEENEDAITDLEAKLQNSSLVKPDGHVCDETENESSANLSPVRSRKYPAKKPCHNDYFHTVHNCVFFATNVLAKQVDLLGNLDRTTLKLLLDSERIAVFSPKLKQRLLLLYSNSVARSRSAQGMVLNKAIVSGNVSFQSDTDNSSNFPSAQCFSNFRKQRDGFYEILRIWEANHQKPGWNFATTLGSRVRSLLHLCSDPINLMHFARLFRLQLLSILSGASNRSDDEPEDLQFLEGLRGIDPAKLNRLKDRLVTPYKAGGPRPEPSFPGSQEFYRDFILSASHLSFLQHLQDSLISHLLELDQMSFLASDTEDSEFTVDNTTRQNYLSCVVMMRLLAKFLGLIVFLPYSRSDANLSHNIRETEVSVRSKVMPPLDILKCVVEAHKNHRLIVTIPWVVKFLGMMDSTSSALPVYQTVIQLLLRMYMDLRQGTCGSLFRKNSLLPSQTVLLLRLSLGWLFEASFIQETFFYSWCFNLDETLMLTLDAGGTPYFDASLPALDSSDGFSVTSSTAPPVDALNLVDCEVLYTLCPFLMELRSLLASTPSECAPRGTVRHITPVSAGSTMLPLASSGKQLELKLEDSFFHGLPASVLRTVEFVVERVTSSCVKHICNVWLPSLKQKGVLQLQEKIKSYQTETGLETDSSVIQSELKKEINSIVDQVSVGLKAKCRTGVAEFCSTKCKGALFSLLPEESLSVAVCEMCVKIASRMSEERVISWMQNHATLTIYSKDLQSETEKAIKNRERCEVSTSTAKTSHIAPGASASWKHDDSSPSPFAVLQSLKIMVCDILNGLDISRECVDNILNQMEQCVTKRQDVVPAAERILALLSVDLIVSLVCHNPRMVDSSLLSRMVSLWKLDALRPVEDGLARLVCPRNMLLLAQSSHQTRLVWEKLAEVVAAVLKANLVTPDLIENQCLAIMQQEWPQNILRCFAMCMNEVVRQYQKQKDVDYKFVLLLEWLAETMAQIDYFPHL